MGSPYEFVLKFVQLIRATVTVLCEYLHIMPHALDIPLQYSNKYFSTMMSNFNGYKITPNHSFH